MINLLDKGDLGIITEDREDAPIVPIDILKQKYLLNSGIVFISLNQDKTACKLFTACLRTGQIYDPRIRRDCVLQLQSIFEKHRQSSTNLKLLSKSFRHKDKSVVFLVNVEKSMDGCLPLVQDHLQYIFEKGLEDRDKISLITYSKNCRRLFSLVEREKNFVQLRNQITRLEANQNSTPNLKKAVKEAVKEFIDQEDSASTVNARNNIIICMTNQLGLSQGEEELESMKLLLQKFDCNMIVFGYDIFNLQDQRELRQVCQSTPEGRFLNHPTELQIEELFVSLANYKFENHRPMILETFN